MKKWFFGIVILISFIFMGCAPITTTPPVRTLARTVSITRTPTKTVTTMPNGMSSSTVIITDTNIPTFTMTDTGNLISTETKSSYPNDVGTPTEIATLFGCLSIPVHLEWQGCDTLTPSLTIVPPIDTYTPTFTFTPSWTYTPTATFTQTSSSTFTPTASFTFTPSSTRTSTFTPSFTFTSSRTPTSTNTPTKTNTPTATFTASNTPIISGVLAFPGVEGFGANALGGRGGVVYEVTNTNDSGAGSLRACVQASGARTCVFKVGGLIALNSPLIISNPYITIAGQTAPGGGITLKLGTSTEMFSTQTHDVIIRYISERPGDGGENHGNQIAKNGVGLYNIVIDHNSISWGVDSNIETWYRVNNATIQWNIISEGLDCSTHSKGCHSKGLMIGGYAGSSSNNTLGSENISVLNNLMANNVDRNPLMQMCGIGQVINNVTYNAGVTFSHQQLNCLVGSGSYVNWINNYHKPGLKGQQTDLKAIPSDGGTCYPGKIYMSGNVNSAGAWSSGVSGSCVSANIYTNIPAVAPAVATTTAINAYNNVLAGAGNNAMLSCTGGFIARRDAIDTRVINDVINGTGNIINHPSDVGGWIIPDTGIGCTDSDHDGMPDVWETARGLNPNSASDGILIAANGYTNLENYLNGY